VNVLPFGAESFLVEVDDTAAALDLALWARERIAAEDVVPAAQTVLLRGVSGVVGVEAVTAALAGWRPGAQAEVGDLVEVLLDYDGPDLAEVAQGWGITVDEVVRRHQEAEHRVAFCGFAPGFPYLTSTLGLSGVPRRGSPRTRVEPGSVGLAGAFTGIYPSASPGGWQLIGRTDVVLWDAGRDQPALLPPGTRVRFSQR
jgi:allophanate hydrolase subunit 1